MKTVNDLLKEIKSDPTSVVFSDVIETIDKSYLFTPTGFTNGDTTNEVNQNNGSCKVFAFGKLHQLTKNETLNLFGSYYRKEVLEHPENDDHQNIRNFIQYGWEGVEFSGEALQN